MNKKLSTLLITMAILPQAYANETIKSEMQNKEVNSEKEYEDMSDPLAVYTQAGFGVTNKGLNLKIGQVYDTGNDITMGMNIIEVKGIGGELTGWDSNDVRDNSIDSIRFRNFTVDTTTGRGTQIDVDYAFKGNHMSDEWGSASYSFIQSLPKWGKLQLYPLAGVGLNFGNNIIATQNGYTGALDAGFGLPGAFGLVGMYSKYEVTDKIWINYNPMYSTALSGSTYYKDNAYGTDNSDIFLHEFAVSYQINNRSNIRYFANWNDEVNFGDGDHRVEYNYQF